ncbi:MAG: protein kinase, partial [Acidobacteriota bacterium]
MTVHSLAHHELLERLGEGAMGVAWKARDTRDDSLVAVKVLHEGGPRSGGRRLRREFLAASRLSHPNVVRVLESGVGEIDGRERPWFSMELVEGRTLADVIADEAAGWPPARNSPEWLASRLGLLHQVALGLEHCHEHGVLHRDLKPSNVLVQPDGTARLVDFGLARLDGRISSLSGTGQLIGTIAYAAPEQVRGGQVDARSDLWAAGAVMQEVLGGRPPFLADGPTELLLGVLHDPPRSLHDDNPELAPALVDLVTACLAKNPDDRPRSAAELATRLHAIATDLGVPLDRESSASERMPRALAPRLVGREDERERLLAALQHARTDTTLVSITGPSGVGKSRLVDELRIEAELLGFQVLGSASRLGQRPLGAFVETLIRALPAASESTRHDQRVLHAVLPELSPSDPTDELDDDAPDTPDPTDRLRVTWAAEAVLSELLTRGPHLLVLDDLQWADTLSIELVERLVERAQHSLLLLTVFRDDEVGTRPAAARLRDSLAADPRGQVVRLEPFDVDDVGLVVESMLGVSPSTEFASRMQASTGGLPHDIEQVTRELATRGVVQRDEHGEPTLVLPSGVDLAELSASEASRNLVDALGPTARSIVQAVVIAGSSVDVTVLGEALSLPEDELLEALDRLVDRGLLRDGPGTDKVSLGHDRLREAMTSSSSGHELIPVRRALARALERSSSAGSTAHRVAELDLAAASLDDALRSVPSSAEALTRAGLHAEALERLDALLDLAGDSPERVPLPLQRTRAQLLEQLGRREDAATAQAGLIQLAEFAGAEAGAPRWQLHHELASMFLRLWRLDDAKTSCERGLTAASAVDDDGGRSRLLGVLGQVARWNGDAEEAGRLHAEAVGLARRLGSHADLASALNHLGIHEHWRGRIQQAGDAWREAVDEARLAGDVRTVAATSKNLSSALLSLGELEAGLTMAREAAEAMRRMGSLTGLAGAVQGIGNAALTLGDVIEAEAAFEQCVDLRSRLGEAVAEGMAHLSFVNLWTYRCRWSLARRSAERARECFLRAGDAENEALATARLASSAWSAQAVDVRERVEEAVALASRAGATLPEVEAQRLVALLEADDGRAADACSRLRETLDRAHELGLEGQAAKMRRDLLVSRVLADDLEGLLDEAEECLSHPFRPPEPVRALELTMMALAFRACGEPDRAAELLERSEEISSRLREKLPDDERKAFATQHVHARLKRLLEPDAPEATMSSDERAKLDRLEVFHSLVMEADLARPESLLDVFLNGALERLDLARGLVFLGDGPELSCRAARQRDGAVLPPEEQRVPDQLLRQALDKGEPALSLGARDEPDVRYEGSVADMGVEAYVAVPVATADGTRVVAYFDGPPPSHDLRKELDLLAPVFADFGQLLTRAQGIEQRTARAEAILSSLGPDGPIVGTSRPLQDLRRLIHTVAPSDASVLVIGENGTGKELVAAELHAASGRSQAKLLSRSCAELADSLLESQL